MLIHHELWPCVVDFPPWVVRRFRARRKFPKSSFKRSCLFVLDHLEVEGVTLVHGFIHIPVPISYAWVELPEGLVFDGIEQLCFQGQHYKYIRQATVDIAYTPQAMLEEMLQSDHFGPWRETSLEREWRQSMSAAERGFKLFSDDDDEEALS
jgi:hypothetical protein